MKNFFSYFTLVFEKDSQLSTLDRLIVKGKLKNNPKNYLFFSDMSYDNKIKFESKSRIKAGEVKLKSLEFREKDHHGYYIYHASREEYLSVYESKLFSYIDHVFKLAAEKVKSDERGHYSLLLSKYELSFVSVINTIDECIEIAGFVDEEIQDKCISILSEFVKHIDKHEEEIKKRWLEELDVVKKSLTERLDTELEYINTYAK